MIAGCLAQIHDWFLGGNPDSQARVALPQEPGALDAPEILILGGVKSLPPSLVCPHGLRWSQGESQGGWTCGDSSPGSVLANCER